jgi:hypothetical protein
MLISDQKNRLICAKLTVNKVGESMYEYTEVLVPMEDLKGKIGKLKKQKTTSTSDDIIESIEWIQSILNSMQISLRVTLWQIINITRGDITKQDVDAVVKPCDSRYFIIKIYY